MGTKIQWTEETWNPVVGCGKVSEGCKHCYAITMANRLAHIPAMADLYRDTVTVGANGKANWTGVVKVSEGSMDKPLRYRKPTMFFVNSMSDLFHDAVPFEVVDRVYDIMDACPQHTFQILTKRPERMVGYYKWKAEGNGLNFRERWPLPNVWLGVSVENQKAADVRIPLLLQVPAAVRFLSCEPLLGKINLAIEAPEWDDAGASRIYSLTGRRTDMGRPCYDTNKIHWVIAGGESGSGSRPMHPDWVRSIRDQCKADNVPFFFKQWGDWRPGVIGSMGKCCLMHNNGVLVEASKETKPENGPYVIMNRDGKSKAGNKLDGVVHDEFPV